VRLQKQPKARVHAVCAKMTSGQLPFLGLFALDQKYWIRLTDSKSTFAQPRAFALPHSRSLSDLGVVGCKSTAAVHCSPPLCPIARLWDCKFGKTCPRWADSRFRRSKSDRLLGVLDA
jgi:hypothetical protein